jgi:mono/diheme cytochrome c family protein
MKEAPMHNRVFSVLGLFDSAQHLMDAVPFVKSKASGRLEAYTPYPVHGIEKVIQQRKSPLAGMVFIMGAIGAVSGLALELWTNGIDYPLTTAGKPFLSWEAFVPIMFEVAVLFACFTAGLGMLLLLNRLPFFRHPMLRTRSMPMITKNKFALAVEADGQLLDVNATVKVLLEAGAESTEVVAETEMPGLLSPKFFFRAFLSIAIVCIAAGYITYWGIKLFPVSVPMRHMLNQPRLDPQRQSSFFKDGFGMRMPVAGTVARSHLPYAIKDQNDAGAQANPLPRTEEVLKKGRQNFSIFCSVCHGILGDGKTSLTAAYGAKPANLDSQTFRDYEDGKIYHVIVAGKNSMPSYAAELTEDERWSVIHYVRALQRAYDAKDEDIPKESPR